MKLTDTRSHEAEPHARELRLPGVHASFREDGRRVAIACGAGPFPEGEVLVLDSTTGEAVFNAVRQKGAVGCVSFSPKGEYIVSASWDHTAQVWDAETGRAVGKPMQHRGVVCCASFGTPEGHRIVTASWDDTARVWDAQTGEPITPYLKHSGRVRHAAFSSDGCLVGTGSNDHTARVWNAETGEPVTPPLKHVDNVVQVLFRANGRSLITVTERGDNDYLLTEWPLDADQPAEDLLFEAELLSGHRVGRTRQLTPIDSDALRRAWKAVRSQ